MTFIIAGAILGLVIALAAHLLLGIVGRQADRAHRHLVGEKHAVSAQRDGWGEMRSLVGGWGCLHIVLEFLRGLGVLIAVSGGVYGLLSG